MKTFFTLLRSRVTFRIIKIDVGHFDKNRDVAESYGVPLAKGIPAIAIISSKSKVLNLTRQGELSNARAMGEDGIYRFFKRVINAKRD